MAILSLGCSPTLECGAIFLYNKEKTKGVYIMDANTLSQLVGSLGFPIVACCVMFYQNSKLQETLSELGTTLTTMNERISNIENKLEED